MKKKLMLGLIPLAALAYGCTTQQSADGVNHPIWVWNKRQEPPPPIDPPLYCYIEKMEMLRENKTGFGASTSGGGWAAHTCFSVNLTFKQAPGIYQFEYAVPYTNLPWGAYPLPPEIPGTVLDWPITNYENVSKTVTLPLPPSDWAFIRLRKMYELPMDNNRR